MNHKEAELRQYFLDQATSLGELSTTVLAYMMSDAGIDNKWEFALKKRLIWVDGHRWTLESAAELLGVTRERMRQVQNQLEAVKFSTIVPPRVLYQVLELRRQVSTLDDFWKALRSTGLAGPEENWSKTSLTELFLKVGNHSIVEDLGLLFRELSPPPPSRRTNSIIRSCRAKLFGTINLDEAAEKSALEKSDVLIILKNLYELVYHNDVMALAIQNPPGAFIEAVGKQLYVNPELNPGALLEGVNRQMAYRGVTNNLSLTEFSGLLELVCGDPPQLREIPVELRYVPQLGQHESAFVDAFRASGRQNLHRDELIAAARERDLNPTSAGVYLSTSPIIRPSGVRRGYFRLV